MTCRLDGAKPLSEPMLRLCQLDPKEHDLRPYFNDILFQNSNIFIPENVFEHVVCEMAAILSRGQMS